MLRGAGVRRVIDVRSFPGSRHAPQYSGPELKKRLEREGLEYEHIRSLGGRRRPVRGPLNDGWRAESFRSYADHMATPEFEEGMGKLEGSAARRPSAIMCAEAVPWRCHRRMIADALLARGWDVHDIMGGGRVEPKRMTEFARVVDGKVTYPKKRGD